MSTVKMGFEGRVLYGAAGSTATTLLTNIRDKSYVLEADKADTTVQGDGLSPPIKTEQVVARGVSVEWTMLNDSTDTELAAMLTAAFAGTPIALKTEDSASGKGLNGDVTLSVNQGMPLGGEQTYVFTATPTRDTRAPDIFTS